MNGGHWVIDGEPARAVPATDRGLQFGDGIFETLFAVDGRLPWLERHYERLRTGCRRLGLAPPDSASLRADLARLDLPPGPAVVKILVTAGSGGRGYARPETPVCRRLLGVFPFPGRPAHFTLQWCLQTLARQAALAGIKHLNRLEQVLARREVAAGEADEGLVLDTAGNVIEATAANLFLVRDGQLVTPALDQSGVAGIMRSQVLETAQHLGIRCRTESVSPADVLAAEECFLSNCLIGIRPVIHLQSSQRHSELDGREWEAGPVTTRLQQLTPWPPGEVD